MANFTSPANGVNQGSYSLKKVDLCLTTLFTYTHLMKKLHSLKQKCKKQASKIALSAKHKKKIKWLPNPISNSWYIWKKRLVFWPSAPAQLSFAKEKNLRHNFLAKISPTSWGPFCFAILEIIGQTDRQISDNLYWWVCFFSRWNLLTPYLLCLQGIIKNNEKSF